ncbi:uncharacterized protein LOC108252387 isoform X1 [Diaphorina citri]|jgi:hAT family dimerisation domain.|uniref:Uncharacterized protein LOC108252387 isoform X1 n=1 Tax=Diaphorina citri TaxID=121845 RepID=A0A3Q0IWX2_DIACI|nr:uncharacterized protein LOC108252387 isoform X1 [Diaphorina citri]
MDESAPKKMSKLSGTRWLARFETVSVIYDQFEILKIYFGLEAKSCYTAELLSHMFNAKTKLYLAFLLEMLKKICAINKLFQSEQVDNLKLCEDLHDLLYSCLQRIVFPDHLSKVKKSDLGQFNFSRVLMPLSCVYFGFQFNLICNHVESDDLNTIKRDCMNFLIEFCEQIQNRMPDNFEILERGKIFSPELVTNRISQPDITNIVSHFSNLCGDPGETIAQWKLLPMVELPSAPNNNMNSEFFWGAISQIKNADGEMKYKNIVQLVIAFLTVPFSNAAVERVFSIMNVVKNKLRNRMHVNTCDSILRVRYRLMSSKFEPTIAMRKKFISEVVYHSNTEEDMLNVFNEDNEDSE